MIPSMFFQRKRKENSPAYRLEQAKKLSGAHLHYVTEKTEDDELVLGKGGCVALNGGELIVLCADQIVYRGPARETEISDLLSGNGVVLRGADSETGRERTLILHFSYHRK